MKLPNYSIDTYKTAQAAIDSIDLLLEEIGANCKTNYTLAAIAKTEGERKLLETARNIESKQAKKINQARWDIIEALKTVEA